MRSVRNYPTKESITRRGAAKQNENNIALATLRLFSFCALPCDIQGLGGCRTGHFQIKVTQKQSSKRKKQKFAKILAKGSEALKTKM